MVTSERVSISLSSEGGQKKVVRKRLATQAASDLNLNSDKGMGRGNLTNSAFWQVAGKRKRI